MKEREMASIEAVADQTGLTADQVAEILRSADGGTTTARLLHSPDRIAQRRAELAAERATLDDDIQAMLRRIHGN